MKGIFFISLFATVMMVEPILGFTARMAVGGSLHMKARARMQGASSHNGFANRKTTTSLSAANSPLFSSSAASIVETVSNPFLNPVKNGLVTLRGGAAGAGIVAVRYATRFLDDVAASKTKSWMALVMAILLETTASTLSKRARDTANPSLFAVSVCLNIMRYVLIHILLASAVVLIPTVVTDVLTQKLS